MVYLTPLKQSISVCFELKVLRRKQKHILHMHTWLLSNPPVPPRPPLRWVSGPPPNSPPSPESCLWLYKHTPYIVLIRMLNWAWYLSVVVLSCGEPTPTSWLSRARCSLTGSSLISCDPSQATSLQLHCFIMTWPPPSCLKTTLPPSKYHICHIRLKSAVVDYVCECEMESGRE